MTVGGEKVPRTPLAIVLDEGDSFFLTESGCSRLAAVDDESDVCGL